MSTDDLTKALRIAGQCRVFADPSRSERAIIALADEVDDLRGELTLTERQIHDPGGYIDRMVDLEAERDAARAALGRVKALVEDGDRLDGLWIYAPDLDRALEGES